MSPLATLSPDQIALRRSGVGASEVAAILGLDSYRTALDVYLDKRGLIEPFEGNQFTHWGKRLEGVIVEEYQDRHPDYQVQTCGTYTGAESWMLATPDRHVTPITPDGSKQIPPLFWGLECKQRGQYARDDWGEEFSDEVPHAVAAQCHWGMLCTGALRWDVAVLIGGNDYREYTLHATPRIADGLYNEVKRFWETYVIPGVHPPFTGAETDHRFLLRTYPTHTAEMVPLSDSTDPIYEAAMLLKVHRDAIKKHEAERDLHEARIKEYIADRRGIELPFGKITWTHMEPVEVKAHTRKATRRFVPKFDESASTVAD